MTEPRTPRDALREQARSIASLAVASTPCERQDEHERDLAFAFGPGSQFLATPPEPLDVERLARAMERVSDDHPGELIVAYRLSPTTVEEVVGWVAAEYARLSAQEDAP